MLLSTLSQKALKIAIRDWTTNVHLHVQIAKAYAIYCWITSNITFSTAEYDDFEATSDDYSSLFKAIALHASLEAEVIKGQVRTWVIMDSNPTPHSWNMVSEKRP